MDGQVVDPWQVVIEGDQEHWFESLPPELDALPSLGIAIGNTLGLRLDEGTPSQEVEQFGRVAIVGQSLRPTHPLEEDYDGRPVRRDTAIARWLDRWS